MNARALLRAGLAVALASLAGLARAQPPETSDGDRGVGLGFARAIPFSRSASRDAPAFALAFAPRGTRTAAGELAFAAVPAGGHTVRPGFAGLIELEDDADRAQLRLWPSQAIHFWRAAYAFQLAVAHDALGRRLCAGCAVETTVMFRHESEHYTGSNAGDPGIDYSDRPLVGDAVILDEAAALRLGRWRLAPRALVAVFLPGRSSYRIGPAIDLHVRYEAWRLHPFLSGYAEYRAGARLDGRSYAAASLLRGLAGVAVPSALGDVLIYASADIGNRKGLAATAREATVGMGVRLALGTFPGP